MSEKQYDNISEGLLHMYDAGFLHNDSKRNNIMIKDKRAFVIDLGKAPLRKKYSSFFFSHCTRDIARQLL